MIEQIREWLGSRDWAIVEVDNLQIRISKTGIGKAGFICTGVLVDDSPPDWLANHIRELLNQQ